MEVRPRHGTVVGADRKGVEQGIVGAHEDGLGYRPEDEADALPAGEQHGIPGKSAILGLCVGSAQSNRTVFAERDPQAQYQGKQGCEDNPPAEVLRDERTEALNDIVSRLRIRYCGSHDDRNNGGCCDPNDGIVTLRFRRRARGICGITFIRTHQEQLPPYARLQRLAGSGLFRPMPPQRRTSTPMRACNRD